MYQDIDDEMCWLSIELGIIPYRSVCHPTISRMNFGWNQRRVRVTSNFNKIIRENKVIEVLQLE